MSEYRKPSFIPIYDTGKKYAIDLNRDYITTYYCPIHGEIYKDSCPKCKKIEETYNL